MLNSIEVRKMKSLYCEDEHFCIVIDNIPLDILLHTIYPEDEFQGLIPTILDWVDEPRERSFLLSRYHSVQQVEMLPILMCPDDCDLWCTLIIAEVVRMDDSTVKWNRIGRDRSTRKDMIDSYECIGTSVEWLGKIPSMRFNQSEYYAQLNKLLG
ncbi:hypothetical protein [Paenibacillus sp. GCM10012306]|uniref:hypothetical protein n=1 Tax=Paenibacillus sp. GCM10012306 TaxID=3317342 RepID=UPI0036D410A9